MGTDGSMLYIITHADGIERVAKFALTYGTAVHEAWAKAGLAPELHNVECLPGGWLYIEMEYLLPTDEGGTWRNLGSVSTADQAGLMPQLQQALDKAHNVHIGVKGAKGGRGVHGNLRPENIFYRCVRHTKRVLRGN